MQAYLLRFEMLLNPQAHILHLRTCSFFSLELLLVVLPHLIHKFSKLFRIHTIYIRIQCIPVCFVWLLAMASIW